MGHNTEHHRYKNAYDHVSPNKPDSQLTPEQKLYGVSSGALRNLSQMNSMQKEADHEKGGERCRNGNRRSTHAPQQLNQKKNGQPPCSAADEKLHREEGRMPVGNRGGGKDQTWVNDNQES